MLLKSKVMHLDMSKVRARMQLLNRRILPGKIRRGLTIAGTRFMTDTVTGLPSTPIRRSKDGNPPYRGSRKAGELRASGALFVDGVKKGDTIEFGEEATGKYQPGEYGGTPLVPTSHEACVVFNAPYAARQHEVFPNKTQEGAGIHFMSKKLYGNGVEYIAVVARSIRL